MLFTNSFFSRQQAALGGEYGLLLGLIAIIILTSLSVSGERLLDLFNIAGNSVNNVVKQTAQAEPPPEPNGTYQYIIIDLDHSSTLSTWGGFTEVVFKDENDQQLSYTPSQSYDEYTTRTWNYWGSPTWGATNLNDGDLSGGSSGTAVYAYTKNWGRLVLDFGSPQTPKEIEMVVNPSQYRTDRAVFYGAETVDYDTHLRNRQNTGLDELATLTFNFVSTSTMMTETAIIP